MRYRLRTLLILMGILPPLLWFGWTKYGTWRAEQERVQWERMVQAAQASVDAAIAAWMQKQSTQSGPPQTVSPDEN